MSERQRDADVQVRRVAIAEAAIDVFIRYGYKKTSMDDLARAAGLSRQGLYLHFTSKQALFQGALDVLDARVREAVHAAVHRPRLDVERQLMDAMRALQPYHDGTVDEDHLGELLAAATSLGQSMVADLERYFVAEVADLLVRSGVAEKWATARVRAEDLAWTMLAASNGLAHLADRASTRNARQRSVVRIVMGP